MEKIEDFKSKQIHDKEMSELDNQFYGGHSILLKFKSNAGIIALIISTMQQLTGINPISLYGYQVAKDSIESIRELVPSIINSIQLVGTIKSSFLLHRYGRKDLFVYGSLGLSISLMILFVGLIIQGISNGFGTFLVLLGLCMFSLIFGMTIAPCTWLYIS
jgi:SP family sugar:H+ symporter-like MFS transporter